MDGQRAHRCVPARARTARAVPPAAPARSRTLPVGRVRGVPVLLSPSWFVLAAVVVVTYGPQLGSGTDPGQGYAAAACFAVLLLVSVLLHEVGHCVAALLLGLRVRSITVTFLAGLTEMVDPPRTPGQAYAVSVSGPLVSLLLTGGLVLGLQGAEPGSLVRAVIGLLALTNGGLAVFNLLPGLPLDGGGVLRAALWRLTGDRQRATVIAAQAGRVLAVVAVPVAVLFVVSVLGGRLTLLGGVSGLLIAAFVYTGATAALRAARLEARFAAVSAGSLARPAYQVEARLPLAEALRRTHEAGRYALVVVDAQLRPQALVSEAAVAAVPEHRRPYVEVASMARPLEDGLVLDAGLSGQDLVEAVRAMPAGEYLVPSPDGPRVLVAADLEQVAAGRPLPAVA